MSLVLSVTIVFLSMLIQLFLQLSPAVFAYFYHHALGKFSRHRADSLTLYFLLGLEVFYAITFFIVYFIYCLVFSYHSWFSGQFFIWFMVGIFGVLTLASFFCYYRRGKISKTTKTRKSRSAKTTKPAPSTTELYISRRLARGCLAHAEAVKSAPEAFFLGATIGILELPFTLPLYLAISFAMLRAPSLPHFTVLILYVLAMLLPPLIIRATYRAGYHLAIIQRFRVRSQPFFRLALATCYFLLMFVFINLGVSL